jgi:hypothetical protein
MEAMDPNPARPLGTASIIAWLESLQLEALQSGITFAGVRENRSHFPTVAADFDADQTIGRITVWVTGEFDFEVLYASDGEYAFYRHETVIDLEAPELNEARQAFLKNMANPDERHPTSLTTS